MKRYAPILIVFSVMFVLVGIGLYTVHQRTKQKCSAILALKGRKGDFAELAAEVRTRYSVVESAAKREELFQRMEVPEPESIRLVQFNGEGIPYFAAWAAYDTNSATVVDTVVDMLW